MFFLKQSTAADIMLGPFLDSGDGNTVEGALTITQPDIRLSKNGGAWAQKSAAQTLSHSENGYYSANLSTTDTDTLGRLKVHVHEAGALPVWMDFMVLPANVYDSLVLGTDLLDANVAQWLGTAAATPTVAGVPEVDVTHIGGDAQSGTDLKDFADAGYDPATNKVEGVKLADTLTTYTGNTPQTGDAFARLGAPVGASISADITGVQNDTNDLQTRVPAALVSGRIDASVGAVAANAINDAAVAADMDSYTAKVWVIKEGTTTDHYGVRWFKNNVPITSGITVPTIQVIKGSDGTDLIASTAMTEIGSTHRFKKDESTNKMVGGQIYFAVVTATIDGSSRSFEQQVGRDSA